MWRKSLQLPASRALFAQRRRHVCRMLGVPFSKGQGKHGTEHGPTLLRSSRLLERLQKIGTTLIDDGDVVPDSTLSAQSTDSLVQRERVAVKNTREVSNLCQMLAKRVAGIADQGDFCLTIGGDHSISCGSIAGQAAVRNNLAVVWVDAHPDINTAETTPSGNLHGMVASLLLQHISPVRTRDFEWCYPVISPDKIVYIGLREVDPAERQIIELLKIKTFTMAHIDRLGIARVMEEALDHIDPKGDSNFHMSYDVDCLDPYYVPSTGTAVDGGLSLREGLYVCESVSQTNRLVSMDLVEINPTIGTVEDVSRTVETAMQVICSTLTGDRTAIYARFGDLPVNVEQDSATASLG